MAEELKTCPCCSGAAHHTLGARQLRITDRVQCLTCFLEVEGTYEPYSALKKWNTRAQLPSQGGEAVGEVIALDDGLGTKLIVWNDAGKDLPVGTKLYTYPAGPDAAAVAVALKAMLARVIDAEFGFGEWPSEAELRTLLANSEGLKK